MTVETKSTVTRMEKMVKDLDVNEQRCLLEAAKDLLVYKQEYEAASRLRAVLNGPRDESKRSAWSVEIKEVAGSNVQNSADVSGERRPSSGFQSRERFSCNYVAEGRYELRGNGVLVGSGPSAGTAWADYLEWSKSAPRELTAEFTGGAFHEEPLGEEERDWGWRVEGARLEEIRGFTTCPDDYFIWACSKCGQYRRYLHDRREVVCGEHGPMELLQTPTNPMIGERSCHLCRHKNAFKSWGGVKVSCRRDDENHEDHDHNDAAACDGFSYDQNYFVASYGFIPISEQAQADYDQGICPVECRNLKHGCLVWGPLVIENDRLTRCPDCLKHEKQHRVYFSPEKDKCE